MGLGRTALGRSLYHVGTAVDGVGGTCGSRGGMVSWLRSWYTSCRAWYRCQATLPKVYPQCSGDVVP